MKSKFFLTSSVFFVVVSVVLLLFRTFILMDYPISVQVSCDPSQDQCFVHVCDPDVESCSGNLEEDTSYYKIVNKLASRMLECSGGDDCPEPSCDTGEIGCEVVFCIDEVAASHGETCNNPSEFNRRPLETGLTKDATE
jgi:hypothetical protein